MGKYNISIEASTPPEYRDKVELWLETVIDFLTAIPRPQSKSLPAIESLIPDFSEIKFSTGDHFCPPHGVFSRKAWTGYMVLPVKDNGDLLIETTPHLTLFMDQDVALASMVCWVHMLDQMFLVYKHPETHLYRQIQFLEKFHPELHKKFIKERNAARSKAQRKRSTRLRYEERERQNNPQPRPRPQVRHAAPPKAKPYVHTTPVKAKPSPELNEYQRKVRAQHQALWDCVQERVQASCEDFDK